MKFKQMLPAGLSLVLLAGAGACDRPQGDPAGQDPESREATPEGERGGHAPDARAVVREAFASLEKVDWESLAVEQRPGAPSPTWRLVLEAEWNLVRAGPQAVPQLTPRLQNEDVRVRVMAARALGRIGSPAAVEPLARRLEQEAELPVLSAVVESLQLLGGEAARTSLRQAVGAKLAPGPLYDVRREAEKALQYMHEIDRQWLQWEYEQVDLRQVDVVKVGEPVPDLTVVTAGGEKVRLSELWSDANLVLVFLFADFCMYCDGQIKGLHSQADRIAAQSGRVVAVVPHIPARARDWEKALGPKILFLTDFAARAQGLFGVAFQIHLHQQWLPSPTCAIVDQKGVLRFVARGKGYDDRVRAEQILKELRRLP